MGQSKSKKIRRNTKMSVEDPFSVYVPLESLTESTIRSIISVATLPEVPNWDYSERTILIFLLAINNKLNKIENSSKEEEDGDNKKLNEKTIAQAKQVRQWLVDDQNQPLDWKKLQEKYDKIAGKTCDDLAHYLGAQDASPYFELTVPTRFRGVKKSREYMERFRKDGFKPKELKLYWNAEQLENLCSKDEETPPHDPSDEDAVENLRQNPVSERNHDCQISYYNTGIEKAVFDVPEEDAQVIVLNFANEQSPGGGYLRNALAQEEVLLFNSDGYRALLDLKYQRMGGGYAIPEFGCAYVRNMRCVHPDDQDKVREVDMLISACYCLNSQQLYENPRTDEERMKNDLAKFRAFMSAAVANTKGDGSKTYLLLGPIGTGAFGNKVEEIGEVFRQVLNRKMMNSKGPIRNAFAHIWFVSTEEWKNEVFKDILSKNDNEEKDEI